MRAAIFVDAGQPLRIEDVEPQPPGLHDVVVRISASGVCHSDLSVLRGVVPYPAPVILGHEAAGVVERAGDEVTRVRAGDRVIASFVPACGSCFWCRHDQSNLCETSSRARDVTRARRADGTAVGAFAGLGTFAETITVDESAVVAIETDLPDEQLALIGCAVMTGVGAAVNTAAVRPGSSVAVVGCGGVGQAVVQGARIAGATQIIAVDPVELKRKTAEHLGATDLVDPGVEDAVDAVRALTAGRGVDYAFEVIGRPETMAQTYEMARRGGAAVIVGMPPVDAQLTLPAFSLFREEKRVLGSLYGSARVRRDFQRLVDLARIGRLDLGSMVSRTITLDEINDGFRAMEAGEVIRSVIVASR